MLPIFKIFPFGWIEPKELSSFCWSKMYDDCDAGAKTVWYVFGVVSKCEKYGFKL